MLTARPYHVSLSQSFARASNAHESLGQDMDKQFLIFTGLLASGTFGATLLATTPGKVLEAPRVVAPREVKVAPLREPVDERPYVYFRRCDDARAAGVAPIRRGQPGYRPALDRDGDGVACEPYRGR